MDIEGTLEDDNVQGERPAAEVNVRRSPPERFAVDPVVKLFGLIATLCYLMGFLVVNASLVGLGASDLSALSPRLVFIGALGLALAAAPFVLPFTASWIFQSTDSRFVEGVAVVVALVGLGAPTAAYVLLAALSDNAFLGTGHRSLVFSLLVAALLMLCSLAAACCGFRVWLHLSRPDTSGMPRSVAFLGRTLKAKRGAQQAPVWMSACFWTLPGLVALFLYVFLFGRYIYPTLPAQLGGGKPTTVRLVVATADVKAIQALHLCDSETGEAGCGRLSGEVGILFEDDHSYLVRKLPDGALALVKKDIVTAIHVRD